jgi:Kelch motif protein/galactose oxidase-like protein
MPNHKSPATVKALWQRLRPVPVAVGAVIALAAGTSSGALAASSAPRTAAATSTAGTWQLLPKAPVTSFPTDTTAVWTGHEMIIHGNYYPGPGGVGFRSVTFAYRPATGKWVHLASSPSSGSAFETTDAAVWTGSRMLVFGQTSASYNPATNTWRKMRLLVALHGAVTGWTGHRFFAWGGTCCADTSHDGAVYNVVSNTWRQLPTAPLSLRRDTSGTWTGRELVVAGGYRFGTSDTPVPFRDAAAYNLATNRWRKIAPMPRREYGATAVWDGKEILFLGGTRKGVTGPPARGLAYNPRTNRWRLLPSMAYPRFGFAAVWTGRQLLIWGGLTTKGVPPLHGEAYNPATNKWTALPASPLRGRAYSVAVWNHRRMFVWGGTSSSGSGFADGAVFTPAR